MKTLKRTAGRGLAAGLAGSLVLGATALVAAPAQADESVAPVAPHLNWQISTTFVEHLFTGQMYPGAPRPNPLPGTATDGASFVEGPAAGGADDTFTFPQVEKKVVGSDVVRSYKGTVSGTFVAGGTRYYAVTVANPIVTVDAAGKGTIKADVSSEVFDNPGQTAGSTTPKTVTVAEIDTVVVDGTSTVVTPKWAGVLPAGSQAATDLGLKAGVPIDGNSFHPEFVGNLMSSTNAHFYQSSTAATQAKKKIAPATLVTTPSLSVAAVTGDRTQGLSITAKGSDFSATTKPGDAGVYVALAPADAKINYADRSSMAAMASVDYVTPARFQGGEFTAALNAPVEKLKVGTQYAIFTWQAHTHSTASQDTKTLVNIDWSKFAKKASKTTVKVTKKATKKKTGTVKVTVASGKTKATGKVTVKVKAPGKKAITKKVTLKKGVAKVALTKAKKKGTYSVTVSYKGDKNLKAAKTKVVKFKVKK